MGLLSPIPGAYDPTSQEQIAPGPGVPASWGQSIPGLDAQIQQGAELSPLAKLMQYLGVREPAQQMAQKVPVVGGMMSGMLDPEVQMAEIPIGLKKIPKDLEPLAQEARKYNSAPEFEKAFIHEIKHGKYYHVTDNPDFKIDPALGPRDMSSMARGQMTPGKLMTTSDLEHWADYYSNRKYVAVLDFSDVPPKDYFQVNRGFGNEFFVNDPSKVKVEKVIPTAQALKEDRKIRKTLSKHIYSSESLADFYNKAVNK